MTPLSAIRARGLVKAFGGESAVDGVDLDVPDGQIHAIVGLNGAGKTTLMRLLLGMLEPDEGVAEISGLDVRDAPSEVWAGVGHLIESPFAYPELTVRENVAAGALLHGVSDASLAEVVEATVEEFGLAHWARRRASTLSLGNRQRLGLASSMAHEPRVLVLDEPSNALDPAGVVFVRQLLRGYADRGAAVLVSSHHFDQVARVADRITVLHRGRQVGQLAPDGEDMEQQFFDMVHAADLGVGDRP
ncbi:MAG: ABC transporter ATP-binding protein [Acidimicrobiia bacterium]